MPIQPDTNTVPVYRSLQGGIGKTTDGEPGTLCASGYSGQRVPSMVWLTKPPP